MGHGIATQSGVMDEFDIVAIWLEAEDVKVPMSGKEIGIR